MNDEQLLTQLRDEVSVPSGDDERLAAKLAAAKAKLAEADAAVKDAEAKLKDAKVRLADLERQAESGSSSTGKDTGSATGSTTTAAVSTPASADVADKAAVRTNSTAKLGATGVDTAEVMVFAMVLATAAGATMELRRRGQGRYDVMARHAD